jgi:hypothetical protein
MIGKVNALRWVPGRSKCDAVHVGLHNDLS